VGLGGVVKGDGFDDGDGEAPEAHEVAADFGVGGAPELFFDFGDGEVVVGGLSDGVGVGGVEAAGDDEHAAVVEEAGGEGFVGGGARGALVGGDEFGGGGGGVAVAPEVGGGEAAHAGVVELFEDACAEDEGLEGIDADVGDGLPRGIDLVAEADKGGVGEVEEFGGHADVFLDDSANVVDFDVGDLEGFEDLGVEGGAAGEPAEACGKGAEVGVAEVVVEVEGALDGGEEDEGFAGFAEILVDGADAFHEEVVVGVSGEDDADGLGVEAHDLVEEFGAGHAGHEHVGDNDVVGGGGEGVEGLAAALGGIDLPLVGEGEEGAFEAAEDAGFVVNEQEAFHCGAPCWAGWFAGVGGG